jgi:type II secretory pathway component PulJ
VPDPVLNWFKVRAPVLALLATLLGVAFSTYAQLARLEQEVRDSQVQEQMIWQAVGRIETRLMVVK